MATTFNNGFDHSRTNVQVAGVDEGDIVEFDDDFIYVLNKSEVVIVDALPAAELSVVSRVDIQGRPVAQFLRGDRLTVISEKLNGLPDSAYPYGGSLSWTTDVYWSFPWLYSHSTVVTVIDVSDRSAPTIVQTTEMDGTYVESRAAEDFVYVVVSNTDAVAESPRIVDLDNDPETMGRYETREEYLARITANIGQVIEAAVPNYTTYGRSGEVVQTGLLTMPEDILMPLTLEGQSLISIVSFDIESGEAGPTDTASVYSTNGQTVYASMDSFYILSSEYKATFFGEFNASTRVMKFDFDSSIGDIDFAATTTVPGTILNQFSVDENGPYLRIATNGINNQTRGWENMLFVLSEDDGEFEINGSLRNLAPGERITSVRFLEERAFIVTFRQVDPLFAIDLSDPSRPEVLGQLTIPGFSSYLHPINENYLLAVGSNGPAEVSIFDVSVMTQPRRIAQYTFEHSTFSEAQSDHRAFNYDSDLGLLAIPVASSSYEFVDLDGDGIHETRRWTQVNKLAVFRIDAEATDETARLVLTGTVGHETPVRRSGFMGDKLYSVAGDSVKVVDVSAPGIVIAEAPISALAVVEGVATTFPIFMPVREFVVQPEQVPTQARFAGMLPYRALGTEFLNARSPESPATTAVLRGVASDFRPALNKTLLALDGLRNTAPEEPKDSSSLKNDSDNSRIPVSAIDQALGSITEYHGLHALDDVDAEQAEPTL